MQSTFRLGNLYFDPCRGSLITFGRALECEEIFWNTTRGREWMFHFPFGKHIALLHPLLESESSNGTCQKSNAFAFFSRYNNIFGRGLSRAKRWPVSGPSILHCIARAGCTRRSRAYLVTMAWSSIYGKQKSI